MKRWPTKGFNQTTGVEKIYFPNFGQKVRKSVILCELKKD